MQDLFDRVLDYEMTDRNKDWGIDWKPHKEEKQGEWSCISPKNQNDRRRLYVAAFRYDKQGIIDENEGRRLFEEKQAYMKKIQNLGKTAVYTCGVDYAAVKELEEGGKSVGFDVLLRHVPMIPVTEFLRRNESAGKKSGQLVQGTAPETEEARNKMAEKLAGTLMLGLQEVYCAGLTHGHINPDHILVEPDSSGEDFKLSIPGEDALFKSAADDRKTTDYYTAPELIQDENRPVDMQTDLYSAGLILYQLLNEGRMPFETDTVSRDEAASIRNSGEQEIPLPKNGSQLMQYIAKKACAHDPVDRYSSVSELAEDLKHADSKVLKGFDPMSIVTISAAVKQKNAAQTAKRQREAEATRAEAERLAVPAPQVNLSKKQKKKTAPPAPAPNPEPVQNGSFGSSGGSFPPPIQGNGSSSFPPPIQGNGSGSFPPPIQGNGSGSFQQPIQNQPVQNQYMQNQGQHADGMTEVVPVKKSKTGILIAVILLIVILTVALLIGALSMVRMIRLNGQGGGNGGLTAERTESQTVHTTVAPQTSQAEETIPTEAPTTVPAGMDISVPATTVTEPPTEAPTEPPATEDNTPPTYVVIMGKYTWEQAQAYCRDKGGHLATIHSDEDWELLIEAVENARFSNDRLKYLWLGATTELGTRPSGEEYIVLDWVDHSDSSYIMDKTQFTHWYYNANLGIHEPSGYDAYEYINNKDRIFEPYLLLWSVKDADGVYRWSLNDVGDVSGYSQYNENSMGFVMELD